MKIFFWSVLSPIIFIFKVLIWPSRFLFQQTRKLIHFFQAEKPASAEDIPTAFLNSIQKPSLLVPHLNAVRKTLLRSVFFLILGVSISSIFSDEILAFLASPMPGGLDQLMGVDITEPISAAIKVVLLSGFAFALPFICFEIWLFAVPAMDGRERLLSLLAIPMVFIFFISGMMFAYYVLLPTAIPFMLSFMGLQTIPRPNSFFPFIVNLMFWMGVSFEFPFVIVILARMGLVTARKLLGFWRYAMVIIAVFAAVITTTTDPWNMGLAAIPMVFLYFLSIGLAFFAQKRKPGEAQHLEKQP